ncbi:MAG: hypothetical protein NTX04_07880 [Verrucomicrobia bacterium]|nr:hypothetical protein [Verrucomicrobiota bacterium]
MNLFIITRGWMQAPEARLSAGCGFRMFPPGGLMFQALIAGKLLLG